MLIVIEGIDGSGKTTQAKLLIKALKSAHYKVGTFKFPQYDSFFGQIIKKFLTGELGLLGNQNNYMVSCLYALERYHAKPRLKRLIEKNDITILQRYVTSNEIYQSIPVPKVGRLAFCKWLRKVEYEILGLPKPDLVIYLYLPTRLCYNLIKKRGGKKEIYEKNYKRLDEANNFGLELAASRKDWIPVECSNGKNILSKTIISQKIWAIIQSKIQKIKR